MESPPATPRRRRLRLRLPTFEAVSVPTLLEARRAFAGAFRGQRPALAAAVALTLVVAGLQLLRPWPLKVVFDAVLAPEASGIGGLSPRETAAAAAAATLLLSVLLGMARARSIVTGARVGREATLSIRRQVFDHLHRLAVPLHQSRRTGELVMRLMGDVNTVRDVLFGSWVTLVGSVFSLLAMAGLMLALDPVLGLLALAPMPVVAVSLSRSSRRLKEATRKQRRKQGSAAAYAAESLRQIRLVKAYAEEERATRTFARDARAGERAAVRAARISAEMDRRTEILTAVGLAVVLFVGARRALSGAVSPGDLLVFLSYARGLYKPLSSISGAGVRMGRATACAERLLELLRLEPEDEEGEQAPAFRGELSFEDVRLRYPDGPEALAGASFEVPAGSLAMLVGPNGAGKSTVFSVLLRLVRPFEGIVRVDGQPIERYALASYRGRFSYVPQDVQLFAASIRENVLYGRPDASEEDVRAAVRDSLLSEVVARLPEGLDSLVGEGGATLSGGEARRVMLARAAVRDARVLLLDEPLAGLDQEARSVVARAIRRIAAGRTALVVSHEAQADLGPDLVVRLDRGRVVAIDRRGASSPQAAER